MTENVYSNTSDSRQENEDNLSSNEIRADIDQTRASVGDKIDQLQARLDPNRLKQQAQETVQEMLTDTANSMTDYVRTHKDEMVNSLADAARRNPLPTALIGLGVGWLILESMGGNKGDNRRYNSLTDPYGEAPRYSPRYDSRFDEQRWQEGWRGSNFEANSPEARSRFESSTGRSYVSQGRAPSTEYYSSGYQGTPEYTRSDYPNGRQNEGYGNGQQSGNPISKAASAVKDSVSDAAETVKDVAGDVKEKLTGTVDKVTGTVSDATQQVKEGVSNISGQISDKVGDMRGQMNRMGEQGQRTMNQAGGQMEDWQERARYESYQARNMAQRYAQRGGQQVKRSIEDNPLIYGAVALAAGAALAMLLPQSRAENRVFGEMRDQVMSKGQEVFETAKDHAATVIEEVRPELEEKARQIVSDATQAGKEAVKSATDELKPVVDKAISKSKDEARSAAQEVGVDPSKLTLGTSATTAGTTSGTNPAQGSAQSSTMTAGSTTTGIAAAGNASQTKPMIINRDTMKGQWKQVQGEVKKQWGQLTDDDLMKAEGDYDKLVGSIQQRYGYTRERVDREMNAFFDSHKA